jgi:hypothetical protein
VFRLGSVAGLAIHACMFARALHLKNVGVARFTSLVPGMDNRKSCDFSDRISAVVTVFPEAPRHKPGAEAHEQGNPHKKDRENPHQVLRVFEAIHIVREELHLPRQIATPVFIGVSYRTALQGAPVRAELHLPGAKPRSPHYHTCPLSSGFKRVQTPSGTTPVSPAEPAAWSVPARHSYCRPVRAQQSPPASIAAPNP